MHEIELKLQVPPGRRAEVDAAVAGRRATRRSRLQATYHDTADRRLAAAGLALRLRREGRRWVQTLKGATDDGMIRLEHNVSRGGASATPVLDPALHAGTAAAGRLQACLPRPGESPLTALYRADILRRTRALRVPGGRVELALDTGRIVAGESSIGVSELEIELLDGSPLAVIDTARRWLSRFGLWLDMRSKAERGEGLSRGEAIAPARQAGEVRLTASMSDAAAWQAVLRSCADQVIANASQVASGECTPEHVHQLRVGLRRLRSGLSLFDDAGAHAVLHERAATLFRRLGGARDRVVIEAEFAADLASAMRSAGVLGEAASPTPAGEDACPTEVLRDTASQMLLLDLLEALHAAHVDPEAGDNPPPLRDRLASQLNRWHREIVTAARRFAELDDARRHRLRKRAKRLRYAVEFCGTLFERRAVRRYLRALRALRALQERLGAVSDVAMALQAYARHGERDPRAMFAMGWLAARRDLLVDKAAPELKAFGKAERFWK